MKNAYIEHTADGWPIGPDVATAAEGLMLLGYTCRKFTWADVVASKYSGQFIRDNMFVGSYRAMRKLFSTAVATNYPPPIDYPDAALPFLQRRIFKADLRELRQLIRFSYGEPLFAKSVETKLFTGRKFCTEADLAYVDDLPVDTPVWVSNVLPDIHAEWRAFIHNGLIVDVRPYAGAAHMWPTPWSTAQKVIKGWAYAPVAYTVDVCRFGNAEDAYAAVVEVNDFWAIDGYGLQPELYAQMLVDRYAQIVETDTETLLTK